MSIASINPATGETLKTFAELSDQELEEKLQKAKDAYQSYRFSDLTERAQLLRNAAEILEVDQARYGRIMTEEMGKPLPSAMSEAVKCAWVCRYYADNVVTFMLDEFIDTDADRSYVRYLPLGPILAVMPWNFPFWQVFRFAAPALALGNVGLLKHASNVPQCALAIEEILHQAGFPNGAFQTLLIGSKRVEPLLGDERIKAATLTGSEAAGAKVAAAAGKNIKKTVLELGGSDPFVVMPSADLDKAIQTAVKARTINSGQSCIAAKRFIVHEDVYDAFEQGFVERLRQLKVGDPMAEDTDIGPLATPVILETVDQQVKASVHAGARLLTGGTRLEGPGNFYDPTALADIPASAPAYREEVFGPVALLFKVPDIDAAIQLANDSPFGLASSVWTTELREEQRFVDELEAGSTFVNAMVASDPRLPFGGVKRSGYGRELARQGMREFANCKTVYFG